MSHLIVSTGLGKEVENYGYSFNADAAVSLNHDRMDPAITLHGTILKGFSQQSDVYALQLRGEIGAYTPFDSRSSLEIIFFAGAGPSWVKGDLGAINSRLGMQVVPTKDGIAFPVIEISAGSDFDPKNAAPHFGGELTLGFGFSGI